MAAPNGTVWGPVVKGNTDGRQGKLGVYIYESSRTDTQITFKMQIWFATIYSCSDGDGVYDGWYQNRLHYYVGEQHPSDVKDDDLTPISKEFSIQHKVNTGSAWNTNNQTKLGDDITLGPYNRGDSDKALYVKAKFEGIDMLGAPVYSKQDLSFTVPAIEVYTITYNENTATDRTLTNTNWSAGPQSKKRGESINLLDETYAPQSIGWICTGWYLSSDKKLYSFGELYTKDASAKFYANWTKATYKITYNKNAADAVSGSRTSDTQRHGESIKLPSGSEAPTRANHKLLGWATSASATEAEYTPAASYQPNANVTLYAVWQKVFDPPSITRFVVERCDKDGIPDDEGTGCNVSFSWKLLNAESKAAEITVRIYPKNDDYTGTEIEGPVQAPLTRSFDSDSGFFNETNIAEGLLSTENAYEITITISEKSSTGSTIYVSGIEKILPRIAYPIDVLAEGKGIAFGKPAKKSGIMDIGFVTEFNNTVNLGSSRLFGLGDLIPLTSGTDLNTVTEPGMYSIPSNAIAASLGNFLGANRALKSGRLEVWTAHGYKTDTLVYRMQRYTRTNGTMVWSRLIYYDTSTSSWVYEDWKNEALLAYPVGSIYMAYNHNDPADLFGGTWVRIIDRFLWGVDEGETIGKTSGEATHTLTVNEMPKHQHALLNSNTNGSTPTWTNNGVQATANTGMASNVKTSEVGAGAAHNNMPPYIQVSIWRRTA